MNTENQQPSNAPLAVQAAYSQLKESLRGVQGLLPGSPGCLKTKTTDASGITYVYRSFYTGQGKPKEVYVARAEESNKLQEMQTQIDLAKQIEQEVRALRKLGYQVADKTTASVLVELFNHGLLGQTENSLVMVGSFAYGALLNELGLIQIPVRTLDIDFAAHKNLIGTDNPFEQIIKAANPKFIAVPGMPSTEPSTSLKLPGLGTLSVDMLTTGKQLGRVVPVKQIHWHAQEVPMLDFLIEDAVPVLMLAGSHAVPCRVPSPERFALHKVYSASQQTRNLDKKKKDLYQAQTLIAHLKQQDPEALEEALNKAPTAIKKAFQAKR